MKKTVLGLIRAPFLVLTPCCVAIGIGTAYWQTREINILSAFLALIGAVASHMCVNAFNEYFDFKSGLDAKTQRTPFSGGSGTLPDSPQMEKVALLLSWGTFAIVAAIGVYFVLLHGWQLLPLGIFGLILLVTYTIWWVYNPLLCLLAPGLGFGVLMVMGTHFALVGSYSWSSLVGSLVPTFLVSNLLLLNQFPDVEADKTIGRRHFPITIGRKASSHLYGAFLGFAYLAIIVGVIFKLLPLFCLLALITLPTAWNTYRGVWNNAEDIQALIPFMGKNVQLNLSVPSLVAVGLFLSSILTAGS